MAWASGRRMENPIAISMKESTSSTKNTVMEYLGGRVVISTTEAILKI
jgi:hypothetical protein